MDKFTKKIAAYYAKQIAVAVGFSFLYCLALISGNAENYTQISEKYHAATMNIHYPVKIKMPKALRESAQVA
jgi:hypothetical protein